MKKYTKGELINMIQYIFSQSDFLEVPLDQDIRAFSKEDLERIFIILYKIVKAEKSMSEKEKIYLSGYIQLFFKKEKRIYKKAQKEMLEFQENLFEKKEEEHENKLLNFFTNV